MKTTPVAREHPATVPLPIDRCSAAINCRRWLRVCGRILLLSLLLLWVATTLSNRFGAAPTQQPDYRQAAR